MPLATGLHLGWTDLFYVTNFVTLGRSLNLHVPQFFLRKMGITVVLTEPRSFLRESIHGP